MASPIDCHNSNRHNFNQPPHLRWMAIPEVCRRIATVGKTEIFPDSCVAPLGHTGIDRKVIAKLACLTMSGPEGRLLTLN
jgi:hypothetical protein